MKKLLLVLLALCAFCVACNSCTPQPAPVPPPVPTVLVDAAPPPVPLSDAAPGPEPVVDASVKAACAALAKAPCAEGMPGCELVLQKAIDARITNVPLACLVGVKTKQDARNCGPFITCP